MPKSRDHMPTTSLWGVAAKWPTLSLKMKLILSVGSGGQSHKTVSTNHNLFEEKGEPKRCRTEVLPLVSLSNALPLGPNRLTHAVDSVSPFIFQFMRLRNETHTDSDWLLHH